MAIAALAASLQPSAASITTPVRVIREATAAGPEANAQVGIQATVDAFRADLGDPNNGNTVGSQPAGRRQITWDGADNDSAPARLPGDFFNAIAPRGALFGGSARIQFQQSADATPSVPGTLAEFGNINATYPTAFATFSAPRLFASVTDLVIDVSFVTPGSLDPAAVSGFGAVFTDVDVAGSTKIEFFNTEGVRIFERAVLATAGNESLSFLGVAFHTPCIGRVRITSGNGALGVNDITQTPGNPDIVVMDDFIYGEPQAADSVIAFGPGSGAPFVALANGVTGNVLVDVQAFDNGFRRGVSVAAGDVNGDGVADIITGAGPGSPPIVHVFDGTDGDLIRDFFAFDQRFRGGVNVAVGNINGDGLADIIAGAGKGGQVRVFNGANVATLLGDFTAYPGRLGGGVRVAAGDVNGDFLDDVVTVPGRGHEARVRVFNSTTLGQASPPAIVDFIDTDFKKAGAFVAVGDISGDGTLDYILGSDIGASARVRVFDGDSHDPLDNLFGDFIVFGKGFRGGVHVAAADINGNGTTDLVVGSALGRPTTVRVFDPCGEPTGPFSNFLPFGNKHRQGIFVGAAGP